MSPKARRWLVLGGLTAAGLVASGLLSSGYSYGGPDLPNGVSRDPRLLLPTFARKLDILFRELRAAGWDPLLHEGFRTPERAALLAAQGVGKVDSLHPFGAAADIISARYLWSNPKFFQAMAARARPLGLTAGLDFSQPDPDHIQAIPYARENAFRKLTSVASRDAYVKQYLAA